MLNIFWQSPYKIVRVVLKSGFEVKIKCKTFTWSMDEHGTISKWQVTGMPQTQDYQVNFISPNEIAAILVEKN